MQKFEVIINDSDYPNVAVVNYINGNSQSDVENFVNAQYGSSPNITFTITPI